MNTLQHTPGPWKAFNSKKGRIFKHWQVDTGTGSVTLDDAGHWEAGNAHLIAAAPAMYEALKDALACIEQTLTRKEINDRRDKINSALAQAEGK